MASELPPHARIDCGEALRQLWDYLDQELTVDRMTMLRAHLDHCGHCFAHAEFEAWFLTAVQSTKDCRPCPDGVRRKVMTSLRAEGLRS